MMPFWSRYSVVCRLQKGPVRPMLEHDTTTENDSESTHSTPNTDKSRCISCGEQRNERYKITLRQPLRGNGYGRIIETGSVCEQCAGKLLVNAEGGGE